MKYIHNLPWCGINGNPELVFVCLDPSHAHFTAGFKLLWESNITTDLTGSRAQVVIRASGSIYKYRWSYTRSPTALLLLCGLVPNRPWLVLVQGVGKGPRGWGALLEHYFILKHCNYFNPYLRVPVFPILFGFDFVLFLLLSVVPLILKCLKFWGLFVFFGKRIE